MGILVLAFGLFAIGLAVAEHILHIGMVYNPLFWVFYVAILTVASIIKFVRKQDTLVVERLGRYNRTLTAGINTVWPIVERVAYEFDLRAVPGQRPTTGRRTSDDCCRETDR
jgi:regulator of protease activity HflC (stomatin/prohibitin superfamily)